MDIGRNYFYLKRGKTFLVLLKEREGTALSISGVSATLGATSVADRRVRRVELTPKGRALITRGFGEHAAAMEDVARALSKNERLILLRLLKKIGETRGRNWQVKHELSEERPATSNQKRNNL